MKRRWRLPFQPSGSAGCTLYLAAASWSRRYDRGRNDALMKAASPEKARESPLLEHPTLEMPVRGMQKPVCPHFVLRIFRKVLAERLTHFIGKRL